MMGAAKRNLMEYRKKQPNGNCSIPRFTHHQETSAIPYKQTRLYLRQMPQPVFWHKQILTFINIFILVF